MDVIISNYIASLIQTAANPVSMGDLALATVHLIIMHCYWIIQTDAHSLFAPE